MMSLQSPSKRNRRCADVGAVLLVVLIVMVALLGLGMTGLFLTSSSIQMNTNINLRNQAIVVAEAGLERARGMLNNKNATPLLPALLAGSNPGAGDDVPTSITSCDGIAARGAILVDQLSSGCTAGPAFCKLQNVNYPNLANRGSDLPATLQPTVQNSLQTMGQYTVYIRQDQADCRMGNFTCDNAESFIDGGVPPGACVPPAGAPSPPNGAVVVRSEGVASDGRTRVVLEVTMTPSLASGAVSNPPITALCSAGANGCDDNSSVKSGIVVNSGAPQTPPSNGGSGAGGATSAGGAGGSGTTTPLGGIGAGGVVATGGATSSGGVVGTGGSQGCPSGKTMCGSACCDGTCNNNICCPTANHCNNIAILGEYGIWGAKGQFQQWLGTHTSDCNSVNTLTIDSDANSLNNWTKQLSNYGILIVMDVFHTAADITGFQSSGNYWTYGNFGNQRAFTNTEVNDVGAWVRSGRGLMTIVGVAGTAGEIVNPNKLLAQFNLRYSFDHNAWFLRGNTPSLNCWIKNGFPTCVWNWVATAPLSMANVTNLQVDSGFALNALGNGPVAFAKPDPSSTFASWGDVGMVVDSGLSSPSAGGRVVAWADEWLTYNNDWTATSECPAIPDPSTPYWVSALNSCTQRFWNNIVDWLRAKCNASSP